MAVIDTEVVRRLGVSTYFDKSENERDRITRMKQKDQEKYAEEALEALKEKGHGERFGKMLEDEFNIFGPNRSDKNKRQ